MEIFLDCDVSFQTRKSNEQGDRTRTVPSRTKSFGAPARRPFTPHKNLNLSIRDGPKEAGHQHNKQGAVLSDVYGKENRRQGSIVTSPERKSDSMISTGRTTMDGTSSSKKENVHPSSRLSNVSSLRRNLRGTMLSPPSTKKHTETTVLLPTDSSTRLNLRRPNPTLKNTVGSRRRENGGIIADDEDHSVLDRELERFKSDESLLISPDESGSDERQARRLQDQPKPKTGHSPMVIVKEESHLKVRGNGVQMDLSHVFASASVGSASKKRDVLDAQIRPRYSTSTKAIQPMSEHASSGPADSLRPSHSAIPSSNIDIQASDNYKWAEKQCEAFTNWLNFKFHPSEDEDHESCKQKSLVEGQGSSPSSYQAFRRLLVYQRMTQVRLKALDLFNGEKMAKVKQVVGNAVSTGRLSIRKDRDMYADLTLRKKILSLLMSYSLPWLRLGLETLCGETISPELYGVTSTHKKVPQRSNQMAVKSGKKPMSRMARALREFIISRVLSDPDILFKYTKGKCKVPSGKFEKLYREDIKKHALSRILILIFFLDEAKLANVTEKVPNLFAEEATVKSSREVLVRLCRDFLSSEGDIIKHLSRMGLTVSYKQDRIDELDFTVTELAVDLRDGVRLARLTEILKGDKPRTLLAQLRLPATSLQRKFFNVDLVLANLRRTGVPISEDVMSHHVVYGHRQIVLDLLWSVVSFFEFNSLLKIDVLKDEILNIRKAKRKRMPLQDFSSDSASDRSSYGPRADVESLLLCWCQEVCSCFGVAVKDFSSSFADGKVICLLLHYYHPGFLSLCEILPTTRDLPLSAKSSDKLYHEALKQEQQNSSIAARKISELGGVPHILPTTDSNSIPEERSVLISLAFLFSRLMESSKEALASITIQACCRTFLAKIHEERKSRAATIILKEWRKRKEQYFVNRKRKYEESVFAIEAFVQRFKHNLKLLRRDRLEKQERTRAATVIQRCARRGYASTLVKSLIRKRNSAARIQCCWRRYKILKHFVKAKASAITIQSRFRGWAVRRIIKNWNTSATQIQRVFRGFLCQVFFKMDLFDIVVVQRFFRRRIAARSQSRKNRAALVIQRAFRNLLVKQAASEKASVVCASAIVCQRVIRRHLARNVVQALFRERAATVLQKNWRAFQHEHRFDTVRRGIVSAQSVVRAFAARRYIDTLRLSALKVQKLWRGYSARLSFQEMTERRSTAVVTIQAWARSQIAGCLVQSLRAAENQRHEEQAAVVCQSVARRFLARSKSLSLHEASISIQRCWRGYMTRSRFDQTCSCAVKIQALFRGVAARTVLSCRNNCATFIQSAWRGHWGNLHYRMDLQDIIIVQSIVRRRSVLKDMVERKIAAATIQRQFRCSQAMHKVATMRKHRSDLKYLVEASVKCQALVRRRLALKRVNLLRKQTKSATSIQSHHRAQKCRAKFHLMMASVRKLQQCFRMYLMKCRNEIRSSSAVKIQRYWRASVVARKYRQLRADIILCQSVCRRHIGRVELKRRLAAVVRIQCLVRLWQAPRHLALLRIERIERERLLGERRRLCATVLQANCRGYLARRDFDHLKVQTIMVQSVWRAFVSRNQYRMDVVDIILAQAAVRRRIACSQVKNRRINLQNKAIVIQTAWRRYVLHMDYKILRSSASIIQSCVRGHLARLTCIGMGRQNMQEATVRIQSRIRGYLVRKSTSKQVRTAAKRMDRVFRTCNDHRMCLGPRTVAALNTLRSSKSLYKITSAVKTLEVTTRYSKECCVTFANGGGPEHLYDFIPSCNRSRPHIQQLSLVLSVLMNVRRYPFLLPTLATDKSAAVLIPVIQMFRETDEVFYFSTCLLYAVISVRNDLKMQCRIAENLKALEEVHELVHRMILIENPVVSSRMGARNHANCRRTRLSDYEQKHPAMIFGMENLRKIIAETKAI